MGKNNSALTISRNFQKDCKLFLKIRRELNAELLRTPTINETMPCHGTDLFGGSSVA